jgi:hypothetical protein
MSEDYDKMEQFYKEKDDDKANGFLFILFLYMISFNPLLTGFMGFSLSSTITRYMFAMHYEWIKIFYYTGRVIIGILIVSSFPLAFGIYKLNKKTWQLYKLYLIIQQIIFLFMIIAAIFVVIEANKHGLLSGKFSKINDALSDLTFRLISSLIIFCTLFIYAIKSKKVKEIFYKKEIKLNE